MRIISSTTVYCTHIGSKQNKKWLGAEKYEQAKEKMSDFDLILENFRTTGISVSVMIPKQQRQRTHKKQRSHKKQRNGKP